MNVFLTTLWLIFGSAIGYFAGMHMSGENHVALILALVGFIVALIIRFAPQILGEMVDALN